MADVVFQLSAPVKGALVLAAYPNGTYRTGLTNDEGACQLNLYRTDQEMKVLAAAEGYLPFKEAIVPGERDVIPLELCPSTDGRRALLFPRDTGNIPGITGALNPQKDGYLFAENIAINGRVAYPAEHFEIGEPLDLIDINGAETTLRLLVVEHRYSLMEYTEPKFVRLD